MFGRLTWDVLGIVAVAILSSYALTALARVASHRIGLLDRPDSGRKSHAKPIPLLGGVALYGSLLVASLAAWWIRLSCVVDDAEVPAFSPMLLVSGGLFCLVGLWDDKFSLRPRTKLLLQIAASLPFVVWGRSVESLELLGADLTLGPLGVPFTIFWLVACANVINLVDGLDGLAGTVGMIVCLAVAMHSDMQGLFAVVPIALIVAGSLFGFLLHNWPPAKIFLGDSGSLLIGFLVGALSIQGSLKTATGFALAVPLVLISVPVFDTFMAIVRRKLNGRGIGQADRGHIHHCLQDRGLSPLQSLAAIAGLCVAMAAAALVSAHFQNDLLALSLCVVLLLLLIAGRVFGSSETLLFIRYLQVTSVALAETSSVLRTRLLQARLDQARLDRACLSDDGFEHAIAYWEQIVKHVKQLGGERLEFACRRGWAEETVFRVSWPREEPSAEDDAGWEINYSVPRETEVQLLLRAAGHCSERNSQWRPDELLRTFTKFCRLWPLEEAHVSVLSQEASSPVLSVVGRERQIPHDRATGDQSAEDRAEVPQAA